MCECALNQYGLALLRSTSRLSLSLSPSLPPSLSTYLPTSLSFSLSLSFFLFLSLSFTLSFSLSLSLSLFLSFSFFLFLSLFLSLSLSFFLSLSLSLSRSLSLTLTHTLSQTHITGCGTGGRRHPEGAGAGKISEKSFCNKFCEMSIQLTVRNRTRGTWWSGTAALNCFVRSRFCRAKTPSCERVGSCGILRLSLVLSLLSFKGKHASCQRVCCCNTLQRTPLFAPAS